MKCASCSRSTQPILGIRGADGKIETSDQGMAEILNNHFSTVGEKLAAELPALYQEDRVSHVTSVTHTVTTIDITYETVGKCLKDLKPDMSCGPDKVHPRLLESAGPALIPFVMLLYLSSASSNLVPNLWKSANISPLFKKDDETDKQNYRPISLLCVPEKIMETFVASTVKTHMIDHDLASSHQ